MIARAAAPLLDWRARRRILVHDNASAVETRLESELREGAKRIAGTHAAKIGEE